MKPTIEYLERGTIQVDWTIYKICTSSGMKGCYIEVCPHRDKHLSDPTCTCPCAVSHDTCKVLDRCKKRVMGEKRLVDTVTPRLIGKF